MAAVLWDVDGVIQVYFIPKRTTISSNAYVDS